MRISLRLRGKPELQSQNITITTAPAAAGKVWGSIWSFRASPEIMQLYRTSFPARTRTKNANDDDNNKNSGLYAQVLRLPKYFYSENN